MSAVDLFALELRAQRLSDSGRFAEAADAYDVEADAWEELGDSLMTTTCRADAARERSRARATHQVGHSPTAKGPRE